MTPSIVICVPSNDQVSIKFVNSLASQMHSLGAEGFDRMALQTSTASTGAFMARNRAMAGIEYAEKQNGYRYDWTVWFDSDMTFPHRTVQALLRHDKDIVGATYKRRAPPFELMGKPLNGKSQDLKMGDLAEVAALPTGCLLIRRSIFDSIKKPYWKVYNAPEVKDCIGEDTLFCQEARAAGYQVWMDTTLTGMISHLAEIPLIADVEQAPSPLIFPKSNGKVLHA